MLDIKLVREKPELVRKNLEKRNNPEILKWFDDLVACDRKWRQLIKESEELRKQRNEISRKIAELKKNRQDTSEEMRKIKAILEQMKKAEAEKNRHEEKIKWYLLRIPNLLHESVPFGKNDSENVVVRTWGKPKKFDFRPKDHFEILRNLGLIDSERAAKASGHGFFYLKEGLVMLDLALQRFAIDFLRKKGYILVEPPFLLRRKAYEGVTSFEDFENVMYKVENEDLYLVATAEHPIAAMYMDEVLPEKDLPIKLVGVSPCFRKEVGAHGKYTKGLFRMHHFNKVEQFIFSLPEQSWELHKELQKNSEELYQKLGLTYRVVNVCTGDIGPIAAKKYDIEVWMADGVYRESGSNSNCTDYQARRLNIRYREEEGKPPKGFVHTLNSTALATSRTMIAIIEQNQQKDGTVKIPKVLQPYMNGIKELVLPIYSKQHN
ncbi:MAG: serine--tRNA ligase [Candidatus Aenigmatarchaeota archaeon]|nr:MAG: serine--tRNA ligase [Candidatus Aenigmarchaeota archaeon]